MLAYTGPFMTRTKHTEIVIYKLQKNNNSGIKIKIVSVMLICTIGLNSSNKNTLELFFQR